MLIHYNRYKLANLIAFFQLVIFVMYIASGSVLYYSILIIALPLNIIGFFLLYYKGLYVTDIIMVLVWLILITFFSYLSPNQDIYKYSTILLALSTFLAAILFRGQFALKLIFYFNLICNLIVVLMGYMYGFDPDFGNEILGKGSRNIVNAYLILAIVYYIFLSYTLKSKVNLALVILFVINCFILYGRSGVALGCIILLYTCYRRFNKLWLIFVLALLLSFLSYFYNIILNYTNFSSGLDTPRFAMFQEYFHGMSTTEIITGRDVEKCCSLIMQYGNPHNSFLGGHINHGISHPILMCFIAVVVVLSRSLDLIFFLTVLYIRYALDIFGLFHVTDIVLFSIFIYSYQVVLKRRTEPT